MAFATYTYTFTNGSTADATQINQNFSDILNGVTDTTKDISVNALTVAGTSTLNGNIILGNSSVKTLAFTASLNSSIPLSTNNSFNIGSSTLGLASIYLGSSGGFTTRLVGGATSSYTITLPPSQAAGYLLNDGSGNMSFASISVLGNYAPNANFQYWQAIENTSTTIANGVSTYGPDQWYGKNGLGTNGVLTISQQSATNAQSKFACQLKITTAPTVGQTNACELYCILNNAETLPLLGQSVSAGIQIKALGNVTQCGIQFFYATSEAKLTNSIGSEGTATVNITTFSSLSIANQTLSSGTITSGGVVGFRVRITGVSSGNLYDINNGFLVELAQWNIGTAANNWNPRFLSNAQEFLALQQFFWKTFPQGVTPVQQAGATGAWEFGQLLATATDVQYFPGIFPSRMRVAPSMTGYNPVSANAFPRNTTKPGDFTSWTMAANDWGFSCDGAGPASAGVGQQCFVHMTADARI